MLSLALALLLLAENGYLLPIILPFSIAIAVQLIRAARLPGKEGLPKIESATRSIRHWHITAAITVAAASAIWLLQRALSESLFTSCALFEPSIGCWLNLILLDLALVAVIATTVLSVLYLGKLQIVRHRYAEFLAFGTLVIPLAVAWTAIQVFAAEVDPDWVAVNSSPFAIACAVLGVSAFVSAFRLNSSRLKTWILASACFLLLVSISGANQPWNPLAIFAAVLVGYAIYRIKWKRMLTSPNAAIAEVGFEKRKLEYAVAACATLLAIAATIHLIVMPPVESLTGSDGVAAQYWKPVLAGYALLGAALIVLTTATGRMLQIRPFATVCILPAAILLPAERFFYLDEYFASRDWPQMIIEAAITAALLWAMWYVFGPGRNAPTNPPRPEGSD